MNGKSALIVEGGAMRSVFSAGLLDGFLAREFNPFDFYIGVSAGAYNLATYLSGRSGMSLHIYSNIAINRQFISYARFLRGGHLLDLDWISKAITYEYQLDTVAAFKPDKPCYVGVTDVSTGEAVYIQATPDNFEAVSKATMALPLIYRDFPGLNGIAMTDGGVADGIPVAEAIRLGARRIMVIRSRHKNYVKKDTIWHSFIRWKLRHYTALTRTMRERVKRFDATISLIRHPPAGVMIQEICPPQSFAIGRFSRSRQSLLRGYETGYRLADKTIDDWHSP